MICNMYKIKKHIKNLVLFMLIFLLLGCSERTNLKSNMTKEQFKYLNNEIKYWIYKPKEERENMPLILYLHGGHGKGHDLDILTNYENLVQYLYKHKIEIPAYVLMPQAKSDVNSWSELEYILINLINDTIKKYNINKNLVSITGHSMGGIGTWSIGFDNQEIIHKIAPLSGRVSKKIIDNYIDLIIPVWSFVGDGKSDENAYESNKSFLELIKNKNQNVKLTVLEGAGHSDVIKAYLNYDILNWLIR